MHGLEHHVPPERITHNHTSSCVRLRIRPCLTLRIGWQRSTVMHTQNDAFMILFASFVMLSGRYHHPIAQHLPVRKAAPTMDPRNRRGRAHRLCAWLCLCVRACVCVHMHDVRSSFVTFLLVCKHLVLVGMCTYKGDKRMDWLV